ncbi:lipopolysaccharide-induced tumor necrosis factor-alpha factor homolog [Halichoeres trimaculatus]|uniref:lipopolysaccharide-induced tumor necrosis factor-alpha factor homolog n=1 Tax=Halichoeres trimaculatus TaxID=147232 RepID=UPI003D9DEC26
MEKGNPAQDCAPPYPGPPANYGGAVPQPGVYHQPGFYPAAPPPAGYQAGPPYAPVPATATVTQVVLTPSLRDQPGQALCPQCQQTVITEIQPITGLFTWVVCAGLALFGCCLCCCIPFCVDSCQDIEHHCPNCKKVIYVFRRM